MKKETVDNPKKYVKKFKSRSQEGVFHRVYKEGAKLTCTCPGFQHRGKCWHTEPKK